MTYTPTELASLKVSPPAQKYLPTPLYTTKKLVLRVLIPDTPTTHKPTHKYGTHAFLGKGPGSARLPTHTVAMQEKLLLNFFAGLFYLVECQQQYLRSWPTTIEQKRDDRRRRYGSSNFWHKRRCFGAVARAMELILCPPLSEIPCLQKLRFTFVDFIFTSLFIHICICFYVSDSCDTPYIHKS